MPCLGQAEPEQSDVPTAGLALPILQLLSCWPCLGPGLCTQPEKLGWAAVFKIKWFSFHSHQRGYKREPGLVLLILFMQFSPVSPVPKANHKGVFVLCKFKVSSSKGKLVRDCKQEAGFYNAWLSEQKYGPQQGSCRPRGCRSQVSGFPV